MRKDRGQGQSPGAHLTRQIYYWRWTHPLQHLRPVTSVFNPVADIVRDTISFEFDDKSLVADLVKGFGEIQYTDICLETTAHAMYEL
jgi:hypothetical protein